ncbi:MAG: hypothetical protein ACKVTZ_15780 [Bacteroidia bacterium]
MPLTLNIDYQQLILLVKQLSFPDLLQLKNEVEETIEVKKEISSVNSLQQKLLSCTIISEEEVDRIEQNKARFNKTHNNFNYQ